MNRESSTKKRLLLALALLAMLWPARGFSQAVGEILGTVSDATGAVVVNAKVVATRTETRVSQSTVTGGAGTFAIPHLLVGTYSVSVEAPGFARQSVSGITLDVSQQRTLDFKLVPVGASETAQVSASIESLNSANAEVGGVVSEQEVESLPLNGRSIQNLVMLQPGMAQDQGSMGWLAPMWISNGNRGETAEATLDGSDATDAEMGTIQFWNFNLDAIAEFKVLQANYSAEFGQGGGSITEIVSKSGTNQLHGSAFEFLRNSYFDAANYFSSGSVNPFQRNEFGFTLGGPIIKNKLFFFGEYAGLQQRYGQTTIMLVPTADERNGLVNLNGYQYQVPLNSVAQQVMGRYPMPNQPNGIYGANTYNKMFKQPTNVNQYSIRVDYTISPKDTLFGRASVINNELKEGDAAAALEDPSFSSNNENDPRNFALSETHIFTPTIVNNLTFTTNRQIEGVTGATQALPQTDFSDGSLNNWGPDTFVTKYVETYYIATERFSWSKGRHVLTMGSDYRYGQDDGYGVTSAGPNGSFMFAPKNALTVALQPLDGGPAMPVGTPSPSGLVSLMAGDPVGYTRSTPMPGYGPPGGGLGIFGLRVWHVAPYIQDDIKLTHRLMLNVGLRYEYNSVPYEIEDRLASIADSGPLFGNMLLNPSQLYKPDRTSFAPRLGFAYKVDNKTVLRGGAAIFSNVIPMVYPDQAAVNFPMASLGTVDNPTYSLTLQPVSLPYLTSLSGAQMPPNGNTKQIPHDTPVNLTGIAAINGPVMGDWASDKLKNGYTVTGNLTFERELPWDSSFQAAYVTSNGNQLYQSSYPNAFMGAQTQYTPYTNVSPGLGEIQLFYNNALSRYNALQTGWRKITPSHGMTFQMNYTWSKDLTDADAVWSAPGSSGGVTQNNPLCIRCEYARASYNVASRFTANTTYQVPGNWGKMPRLISKGWQAMGIYSAQSGFPFTIVETYGTLAYGMDKLNWVGARPDFIKWAGRAPGHRAQFFSDDAINNSSNYWGSTTVYSANLQEDVQAAPGTLGRNTYTGPAWWNLDFSTAKDTQLGERLRMEFRGEFFNVFNHPTMGTPGGTLGSGQFGISSYTQSAERQMQFAVRFIF